MADEEWRRLRETWPPALAIVAIVAIVAALSFACVSCTLCVDGHLSTSTGSGTCSHHGGIAASSATSALSSPAPILFVGWLIAGGAGVSLLLLWRRLTLGRRREPAVSEWLRGSGPAGVPATMRSPATTWLPDGTPTPSSGGRIKVLFLAANPTSTSQLHLAREARQIEERIGGGKRQGGLELVTRWAVRCSDLQRALLEERPHVLHFSGHNSGRAQLLLEDDEGNAVCVEREALVNLIGILKGNLRLVVLNACDTEPFAEALVEHVACAIGMREPIGNDAALAFAASFYQALGFGEPVATAFRLGCNELELRRIPAQQTPSLKVQPGVDPTRLVLTAR